MNPANAAPDQGNATQDSDNVFKVEATADCQHGYDVTATIPPAGNSTQHDPEPCVIAIGYTPDPTITKATTSVANLSWSLQPPTTPPPPMTSVKLIAVGAPAPSSFTPACAFPKALPASRLSSVGLLPAFMSLKLYKDLGLETAARAAQENCYYSTVNVVSYFNQIKSIFNAKSGSATTSADIASLNLPYGVQMTLGTNIVLGASTPTTSGGTTPTLSATSAAQAAQNMLNGGTVFGSAMLPVFTLNRNSTQASGFIVTTDLSLREGADLQSFSSGTSMTVSSPTTHFSAQMEGYLQYNSTNLEANTNNMLGSFFVGGAYGYGYTSLRYKQQYGFASTSNSLGQVSAGVLVTGVVKVAVSRGFGPWQTYVDSATPAPTTGATPSSRVNNFHTLSFGITYQSPPPATTPAVTAATSPAPVVPTVTALNVAAGPGAGGTLVTITGTGFTQASAVAFGQETATSVLFVSPTQLVAVSPAGSGKVDVVVTTTGGSSKTGAGDKFTYQ